MAAELGRGQLGHFSALAVTLTAPKTQPLGYSFGISRLAQVF